MRVAIISTYPPQRFGIAYYTKDLVETLLVERPELDFFILAERRSWIPYRERNHGKIHEYSIWHRNTPSYPLTIFNAILGIKPDIVWIQHEYGLFGAYGGYLLCALFALLKLTRFPIIMTLHTVCPRRRFIESLLGPLRYSIWRLISRWFDVLFTNFSTKLLVQKVIVHSAGLAYQMTEKYGFPKDKIVIIPHGASIPHTLVGEEAKEIINLNEKTVILCFGFLSYRKGYEYVIRALSDLSGIYKKLVLLIAGTYHTGDGVKYLGELRALVKQLNLEENVIFYTKQIPVEETPTLFGAADIVVLPYLELYGDSGVLRQAAAFAKPVITSAVGVIPELVENRVDGIIVPPANVEALKEEIVYLLENPKEASRLGSNLRNKAIREWAWEKVADCTYALLSRGSKME